uniref:Anaphase-promoting complex subunit 4 n=1 Tax=Gadus morhua TaxID=8049 RepID=A0A8C5C6I8_GADMO
MPAFRQVGEKQLPNPVLCMAWSPKRDLIALANTSGELLLHRLANFHRVWSLPATEHTGKEITALAWRPDGKILAFALGDTKQVVLCDVEKAEILHLFTVENAVSCMTWMEVVEESSVLSSFYNSEDESKLFLPKLPALPKSLNLNITYSVGLMLNFLPPFPLLLLCRLNILVVGGASGCVELYAYGMYRIATLDKVRELYLRWAHIDHVLDQLDTGLLSDCLPEVTRMARKFSHISTLLQYLRLSLTCMCEAWEEILMQMDLRLTKFVQEKNTNTQVQDEFLELLLWGQSSPELQALLMNQLTVKGLKKLGQSIESSYSSIQKLVISHLQSGSEALLYHLSEVRGMCLWKHKFEPLGLNAAAIEDAITAVGSFSLKAGCALTGVWLRCPYFPAAMLRMCEEHVPPELNKMTQKDISFVADFLSEHFSENEELFDRKGKYFNVERVGQYLKDEDDDLVSPPNTKGNQWLKFLQESSHLKESPLLFPSYPNKSLHFVKRMMEGVIEGCLQNPAEVIGKSVKQAIFMPLYTVPERCGLTFIIFIKRCRWNDKKANMHYVVFTMPEGSPSKLYMLRRATDPYRYLYLCNGLFALFRPDCVYSCLDARFYDDEMLTVVLCAPEGEEDRGRVLAQLPLGSAHSCQNEFNWDPALRLDQQSGSVPSQALVLENQWRILENMKAQFVAVNGIRKVACVLSANLRHVRMFEMDVEDEEDEEGGDSQKASADQDVLEASMNSQGDREDDGDGRGPDSGPESGAEAKEPMEDVETHLESQEELELV